MAVKNLNYSFMVKFAPENNKLEKSLGDHFKASIITTQQCISLCEQERYFYIIAI